MYKENLERFLATQLTYMRNLRNDRDCLYRLYNQAFGACSFVNDCLFAATADEFDVVAYEWVVELWQNFRDNAREEFNLAV